MGDFPAHLFRMEGDPSAIHGSAAKWSSFGTAAADASVQITSLDSSTFIGPEGDQWRDGLNSDMPRHLQITGDAFGRVSRALTSFANTLDGLQEEMRPLAQRAPALWEALQSARGRVARAQSADAQHARDVANRPPESTEPDTYRSDSGAAGAALSDAQRQWDDAVGQANGLQSRLRDAVGAATREINVAKDMRFKENPKWWDIGGQFTNFVRDHKELLQQLSGALKIVSLVTGLLSFIPVLAPVMAPIAVGTALAASAIDASVYAATGEGNLKTILIDVGLNLLPGVGRLARPMVGRALYEGRRLTAGLSAAGRSLRTADNLVLGPGGVAAMTRGGPDLGAARAAFAQGRANYVQPVTINSSRYPETARHVSEAQSGTNWRGDRITTNTTQQPDVVTLDRANASANRADSLRGIDTKPNFDRDEYPMAMFREGGDGASVKYIDPSDNRGAGSSVRHQLTGVPNGAQVRIVVR